MIHSGISPLLTSPFQLSLDNSTLLFKTTKGKCRIHLLQSRPINTNCCITVFSSAFSNPFLYLYGLALRSFTTSIHFVISVHITPVPGTKSMGPLQSSSEERGEKPTNITAQEWRCREKRLNLLSLLHLETGNPSHRVKSSPGSILRQHHWLRHLLHRAFKGFRQKQ